MQRIDGYDNAVTDRATEASVCTLVASTQRLVNTAEAATESLLSQLAR